MNFLVQLLLWAGALSGIVSLVYSLCLHVRLSELQDRHFDRALNRMWAEGKRRQL